MTPEEWIAHDPDPVTAAELAACDPAELAARFAHPLAFGTAGLRGPVRGGPDAMNVAVVLRATWAVARVLHDRGLGGATVVLYGLVGVLGVRIWLTNQVDFGKPVNQMTAAVALIVGIADFTWHIGGLTFTGIALGSIAALVIFHGMRGLTALRDRLGRT